VYNDHPSRIYRADLSAWRCRIPGGQPPQQSMGHEIHGFPRLISYCSGVASALFSAGRCLTTALLNSSVPRKPGIPMRMFALYSRTPPPAVVISKRRVASNRGRLDGKGHWRLPPALNQRPRYQHTG